MKLIPSGQNEVVDEHSLSLLRAQAALAGTQPITRDALLRRLRSEATTWVNAVRMQRTRLKPVDHRDIWEVEIDLHFLLVALVRLERAVIRAVDDAGLRPAMASELEEFNTSIPGLRRMRDVGEHADEYNLSKGRRIDVPRSQVQSWGLGKSNSGGLVWKWIGQELDVDSASDAASRLYNSFDAVLVQILGDSHRRSIDSPAATGP